MEYLYLKWFDYETNKKHLIGALIRDKQNKKYYFKLNQLYLETAIKEKNISKQILPFSDLDKIYESDEIFAIFKVRLPKIERFSEEELNDLLEELEMKEYDEFEYLRKTNGKLMTDNYIIEEEK